MSRSKLAFAIVTLAISGFVMSCKENPVTPGPDNNKIDDQIKGRVIISEGFESNVAFDTTFKQVQYDADHGKMSISKQKAHSGTGSLTSDSNNTSARRMLEDGIEDSIAGLQFWMMATKKSQTNLNVGIYRMGSSSNGIFAIIGMGISKSDSLQYTCETVPSSMDVNNTNIHTNFAAFELNKWYLCKIEYDYTTLEVSYYLDNVKIKTMAAADIGTLHHFVAMRDGLGVQGPSGYYIDDIKIYKR